ncbi:MAG TPA: molybdopterin cofactor-binding domain-containing protein [Bryobacteraceae bacterium]|jgi:CO/xanthine dehydrogenase Mo-binding subunit|nr:molybdopterin cofactor-binding domain-containing protein [Bryobacteraceae bacterium]
MVPRPITQEPSLEPPKITRRGFVQAGGCLFVSLALLPKAAADPAESPTTPVPTPIASWLEIRSDNTVLVRTGRTEIGTGMSAFYPQVVAEELRIAPQSITLIMGDTDKTPDGGYSAGFLTGAANLRKVAAYTYQALLKLAADHLGVPASALRVANGIVSCASRSVTYSQLIQGQHLDLHIPVSGKPARFAAPGVSSVAGLDWVGLDGLVVVGNPPTKPIGEYNVVGTSFPMPGIRNKVTGKTQWSCDVRLPGMLHARMVRPPTLGSTLLSVGELDKQRFPKSQVIRKANLLAVLSSDEWEAVTAAQALASTTKWISWSGLPGSENLTETLRKHPWGAPDASKGDPDKVKAAFAKASRILPASYEQPYIRHAPIGPYLAVADVRKDGTATIWAQPGHLQASRARMARILDMPLENVVVRWLDHAAQFGRKTFGGDGAEADAAILSKLAGKPVRVQWSLQEDLAWSAASPGWMSTIRAALDAGGQITAVQSAFYSPFMFDARPLGAILAGLPAGTTKPGGFLATEWIYDKIEFRLEQIYAMNNLGADSPYGGLRGLIMRTPGQRQQNFVVESMMNEAAATARIDPVKFRLEHTTDPRLIELIERTTKAANWESRPSPATTARTTGSTPLPGRGMSVIRRENAYWVAIAEILVTPEAGSIQVTKFIVGVECGKIINPRQLERCIRGGVVMGLGEALKEEVTFDNSKVTSTDWSRYQILTMRETPEIRIVPISRDDQGFGGGGETPNALPPPTIAAAFFDATGIQPRRIPLTAAYVRSVLSPHAPTHR